MTEQDVADEKTVELLAAYIRRARENRIDDLTLAKAILMISTKVYQKAIADAMPNIRSNCQPKA